MCVKAHYAHKHDFLHTSHRLFTVHKMLITSNNNFTFRYKKNLMNF